MTGLSLDQIVKQIQDASSLQEVQEGVVPMLRKLEKTSTKSSSVLEGKLVDGTDPLTVLDLMRHSAGYLFILNARLGSAELDLELLVPFVLQFTETGDAAQLRLIPDQVNFFGKQLAYVARDFHQPTLAILPLLNLISRVANPGHLTALHPLLLQVIMYTRHYGSVKDLLTKDIIDLDPALGSIKYQDNLLYHYLGGIIMSLLGQYTRAMDMLEIVVSAPGNVAAAIQVDAYKKLLLMQLLATGQSQPLPKYTTGVVSSVCKQLCGPYIDYATAFSAQDKTKLASVIEQHGDVFERDLNAGLLALCGRSFRRRTIQKLTATYMTLSLVDIAKAIDLPTDDESLDAVQTEILSMMSQGEVHGSISPATDNRSDITVTFIDDPEPYNSHETVTRVSQAIAKAKLLDQSLVARDLQLERSKEYVQNAYAAVGTAAQGGGAGGSFGFGSAGFPGGGFAGLGGGDAGGFDSGAEDFEYRTAGAARRGSDDGGSIGGPEWEELDEE